MVAGKDVAGAAHVSRELVHGLYTPNHVLNHAQIAQIPADELIRSRGRELRVFEVHTADPEAFLLQPFYEMTANEAASAGDEDTLHVVFLQFV
jgi:hypothetical protein